MKKIGYDSIKLDQAIIVQDTHRWLKVKAVLSRSGVYQYDDGKAFKSRRELLNATRTARYAKLAIGDHPATKMMMSQKDIKGGVESPYFDNGKICGVLAFDKRELPEETINKIKDAIMTKKGIDNSIGFYYETDMISGQANNVNTDAKDHYDYIMRDIVIDHVAVVTDLNTQGRCTFPKCGIGADCKTCPRKIGKTFNLASADSKPSKPEFKIDKIVQRGGEWCVIHCHGEEAGKVIKCFPTRDEAEAMHRAIQAQKKDTLEGGKNKMSENKPDDFAAFVKGYVAAGHTEEQAKDYWDEYVIGAKETPTPSVTPSLVAKPSEETPPPKPDTPAQTLEQTPPSPTPTSEPTPELTAEQLIDRSKELLSMREQSIIEKNRAERRHPI